MDNGLSSIVYGPKRDGSGWESNPPRPATRPATGFEDQEAHRDLTTPADKDNRREGDWQVTGLTGDERDKFFETRRTQRSRRNAKIKAFSIVCFVLFVFKFFFTNCGETTDLKQNHPSGRVVDLLSVGARGFEPPTSCTPCKRASRTAPRPD